MTISDKICYSLQILSVLNVDIPIGFSAKSIELFYPGNDETFEFGLHKLAELRNILKRVRSAT